jgi:hypothetical protein
MSERKLEPTPGWCERAYDAVKHGYVNHDLVREYEAAQEPRTYTAAEAEKLCRERPEEVIVFSPRHAFIKGSSPFEYRFNGTCFQFRIADESTCAWENYGIGLSIEREPFTIREVTQAEPLPHEIVSTSGYEKFHCMHCARPVGCGPRAGRAPIPVVAARHGKSIGHWSLSLFTPRMSVRTHITRPSRRHFDGRVRDRFDVDRRRHAFGGKRCGQAR